METDAIAIRQRLDASVAALLRPLVLAFAVYSALVTLGKLPAVWEGAQERVFFVGVIQTLCYLSAFGAVSTLPASAKMQWLVVLCLVAAVAFAVWRRLLGDTQTSVSASSAIASVIAGFILLSWPALLVTVVTSSAILAVWSSLAGVLQASHLAELSLGVPCMAAAIHASRLTAARRRIVADLSESRRAAAVERDLAIETTISRDLDRIATRMIALLDTPAVLSEMCRMASRALGCRASFVVFWRGDDYLDLVGGDSPADGAGPRLVRGLRIRHVDLEHALPLKDRDVLSPVDRSVVLSLLEAVTDRAPPVCAKPYGLRLRRGDETVGALLLCYDDVTHVPTPEHQGIAAGLAHLASLALHNAQLVERLSETDRLKDEFLNMISHELRTPLTGLIGYVRLMQEGQFGAVTEQQRHVLGRIGQRGEELSCLIADLLDFSALQEGRVPVQLRVVSFAELVEGLVDDVRSDAQKKGVALKGSLPVTLPPLRTDPAKLRAVLRILLGNACKFTEKGEIGVSAVYRDQGIECLVTDTGIGMRPEDVERAFEPFHQLSTGLTRTHGGVGLGLQLAKRLLFLLAGTLGIHSRPGEGTEIRLWVPDRQIPLVT